ncbi:hypothetical protein IRY61_02160 [Candidatus Saccharibacteria bacterium]|nr:hypothetical protein [Candidatus Saccharibacteria bacterium]
MLIVRPATVSDVESLAPRLREADLLEIRAAGSETPLEVLMEGLESPDGCWVAVTEDDDIPHVIFGTAPSPVPFLGFVWMMASDEVRTHWFQILRETRPWVARLGEKYEALTNVVHAKNTLHIRWIKWAGFTFLRELEINGESFYEFVKLFPKMEGD